MSDTDPIADDEARAADTDEVSRIRDAIEDRAAEGATTIALPIRLVATTMNKCTGWRDELIAAQRTIALLQDAAPLAQAYELGRQAGVEEERAANDARMATARRAVAGLVDDLAQGGPTPP